MPFSPSDLDRVIKEKEEKADADAKRKALETARMDAVIRPEAIGDVIRKIDESFESRDPSVSDFGTDKKVVVHATTLVTPEYGVGHNLTDAERRIISERYRQSGWGEVQIACKFDLEMSSPGCAQYLLIMATFFTRTEALFEKAREDYKKVKVEEPPPRMYRWLDALLYLVNLKRRQS